MPTLEFEHLTEDCGFIWEDIVFFDEPLPNTCPECGEQGNIIKLISLPAQGKVLLTGRDLSAKLKSDGQQMMREATKNENTLANLVGESKFEQNLKVEKKLKEERPKIKSSRKKSQ